MVVGREGIKGGGLVDGRLPTTLFLNTPERTDATSMVKRQCVSSFVENVRCTSLLDIPSLDDGHMKKTICTTPSTCMILFTQMCRRIQLPYGGK